jgi:hypothetical protein
LANGQSGIAAIAELRGAFGAPVPAFLMSGDTAPKRLCETLRAMVNQLTKSQTVAGAA